MLRNVTTVVAALLIAVAPGARGQSSRPQFEVASIKASNDAPDRINMMRQPGGRFIATGVTAKLLITFAYSVQSTAVIGGPKWMDSDKWDIDARANEAESDTDTMPLRMQSLLESRFQLMAHKEIRESQIYALGVARRGSKLQVADEGASKPGKPPNTMAVAQNRLQGHAVRLASLAKSLSSILGRTVVDKTGLSGIYDIQLQWTPDVYAQVPSSGVPNQRSDQTAPSIFTALEEQLGLKLESTRGPVEVLIIDHVERPTEN